MESQSLAAKRSSMTGFDDVDATGSGAPSPDSMAGFEELDPADNRLSQGSVKSTGSGWFGGSRSSRSKSTKSTTSVTKQQVGNNTTVLFSFWLGLCPRHRPPAWPYIS